jgi:hypothetical protein
MFAKFNPKYTVDEFQQVQVFWKHTRFQDGAAVG